MDWNLKSLYGTQPSKTVWLTIFRAGPWHKVSAVAWNSLSEMWAHALGNGSFPRSLYGSVQHEIPARWDLGEPYKSMLPSLTPPHTLVYHSTDKEKGCPPTGVLLPCKTSISCPKLLQFWAPAGVLLSIWHSSSSRCAELQAENSEAQTLFFGNLWKVGAFVQLCKTCRKHLLTRIAPNLLSSLNLKGINKCSLSHRTALFTSPPHVNEKHFLITPVKIKYCLPFKVDENFALSHKFIMYLCFSFLVLLFFFFFF